MPDHPEGFLRLVKEAKTRIKEEDFRDIKKKLDAGEPMIISTRVKTTNGLAAIFPMPSILGKA